MKKKYLLVLLLFLIFIVGIMIGGEGITGFFIKDVYEDYKCHDCNVIIISIETTRADHLGCYGYERDTTPFIDSFAEQGILFENAFTPRGATWPSLTSMLTSLYPKSHNVRDNGYLLDKNIPTISSILRKKGYKTSAFLAYFCKAWNYGFNEKYCTEYNDDGWITNKAISWLKNHKNKKFFLWMHYWAPHDPYEPPKEYNIFADKNYNGDYDGSCKSLYSIALNKVNLPTEDYDQIISLYDGEIYYADSLIKQVYDALDELGLLNNSIIIITSDHGEELFQHNHYFGHGCSIYSSVLHIPLIIRLPNQQSAGKRVKNIVENIDIVPTILDLIGIRKLRSFEGTTLLPLLNSESSDKFSIAISERRKDILSIRTNKWKYIYNPKEIELPCFFPKMDFEVAKEELYDISIDPYEQINVVSEFPEVAELLKKELLRLYSSDKKAKSPIKADEETLEKLRALGYMT